MKKQLSRLLIAASAAFVLVSNAFALDLANAPLATQSAQVNPNVNFIMDDSGSMGFDYLPDHVDDNHCLSSAGRFNEQCFVTKPPFMSVDFNKQYYDPSTRYIPPVNADGSSRPSMTAANSINWTNVRTDGFNVNNSNQRSQAMNHVNIVTGYPDEKWCDSPSNQLNCRVNTGSQNAYVYPDATFRHRYWTTGGPYYYRISVGEYCTSEAMTTCIQSKVPTGLYTIPSFVRWCDSDVLPQSNCQARKSNTFDNVRYSGISLTDSFSSGSLSIGSSGSAVSVNISSVKVNGVEVLSGPVTAAAGTNTTAKQNAMAALVAANINGFTSSPDYTATASGNTVNIRAATAGAAPNGFVVSYVSSVNLIPATNASGTILIGDSGAPYPASISSVKVGGVEVMGSTLTAGGGTNTPANRTALATAIANAINSFVSAPEYTATASGDVVTVIASSAGIGSNGLAISVTSPPSTTTIVTPALRASGSVNFTSITRNTGRVTQIRAGTGATCSGGTVILMNTTAGPYTNSNGANRLNSLVSAVVASPLPSGWSSSSSGTRVTYTAPAGAVYNGYNICVTHTNTAFSAVALSGGSNAGSANVTSIIPTSTTALAGGNNSFTVTVPASTTDFSGGSDISNPFGRIDITPLDNSYPKSEARTDCVGATCNYAEEMTNFANWYTYYRTRMQQMKTSISHAFIDIDQNYNVGYFTINNANGASDNLGIFTFNGTQKTNWYSTLFAARPGGTTPLKRALTKAGRIYGGQRPDGFNDPITYSCQQNFTILSTDGYWNETAPGGYKMDGTTEIGNTDGSASLSLPYYDGGETGTSNTLSDVAYYYYNTDLRSTAFGNNLNTAGIDISTDNVADPNDPSNTTQHMVTFSIGLGINGEMDYIPGYASSLHGDYFSVKNEVIADPVNDVCSWRTAGQKCIWPKPLNNQPTAVDDLWHAAVNGRGTYFSASNPLAVSTALRNTLSVISRATGSASASATSSPNVNAYDNFIFSSTYRTVGWDGEVVAQTIDINTGDVGQLVTDSVTGQLVRNTTPIWTVNASLNPRVLPAASNPRKIVMFSSSNNPPLDFNLTNLGGLSTFFTNKGSLLSSYAIMTTGERAIANNAADVIDFIKGNKTYEGSVFRVRENVLGDTVNSIPAYVKQPREQYSANGYQSFLSSKSSSRQGRLYIGANDGMLHAFNTLNGNEEWAYIPRSVMPNLYKLADIDYANNHEYFVDGSPKVADVYDGSNWRTILVSGLNKGGKGYFAIDVTDENNPKSLWEFCDSATLCTSSDTNLGFTYGNPVFTTLSDGTPVVLVTSGYDNNNGASYLYVLHSVTGNVLQKVSVNGVGDTVASQGGLSKISAFIPNSADDNKARFIYGGDLKGRLWKFKIPNDSKSSNPGILPPMKLAEFAGKPITTKPEVAVVSLSVNSAKLVVYVGTGKYLELTDVGSSSQQSIYALVDNDVPYTSPESQLKQRIITQSGNTASVVDAATSSNKIDIGTTAYTDIYTSNSSFGGWYANFPNTKERVNLDIQVVLGTLIVNTNIPDPVISCGGSGGDGWKYQFRYDTGLAVSPGNSLYPFGARQNGITVGNVVFTLPNGSVKDITTKSNGQKTTGSVGITKGAKSKRSYWKELINK